MVEITYEMLQPWSRRYAITLERNCLPQQWRRVEAAVRDVVGVGCVNCGPDGTAKDRLNLHVAILGADDEAGNFVFSWEQMEELITTAVTAGLNSAGTSFTVSFVRDGAQNGKRVMIQLPTGIPFEPIIAILRGLEAVVQVGTEDGQITIAMREPQISLGVFFHPLRGVIGDLYAKTYDVRTSDVMPVFVFPP